MKDFLGRELEEGDPIVVLRAAEGGQSYHYERAKVLKITAKMIKFKDSGRGPMGGSYTTGPKVISLKGMEL